MEERSRSPASVGTWLLREMWVRCDPRPEGPEPRGSSAPIPTFSLLARKGQVHSWAEKGGENPRGICCLRAPGHPPRDRKAPCTGSKGFSCWSTWVGEWLEGSFPRFPVSMGLELHALGGTSAALFHTPAEKSTGRWEGWAGRGGWDWPHRSAPQRGPKSAHRRRPKNTMSKNKNPRTSSWLPSFCEGNKPSRV